MAERERSKLRTLPSFLNVNALVKVVFDYLMRFGVSERLVTMHLIILGDGKADELMRRSLGLYDTPHYLRRC